MEVALLGGSLWYYLILWKYSQIAQPIYGILGEAVHTVTYRSEGWVRK